MEQMPLSEFDTDKKAVIQPSGCFKKSDLTEYCVMPIYGKLIEKLKSEGKLKEISDFEVRPIIPFEFYRLEHEGKTVVVANPGIGAPLIVGTFEELIACGCRKFVACGSAGVLKSELKRSTVIIPKSALRDEGTSYHYQPPSRIIEMDSGVVDRLEAVLVKHGVGYEIGRTWTTDAFYRETRGKAARRREEGCIAVDMECSALLAVARFRNVVFGQYLVAEDDISGEEWDRRRADDRISVQEKIFWLSVEACLSL